MKIILRFAALFILLCAVDCVGTDFYYMPFKETEYGADKVSFYLDGTPYRSSNERDLVSGTDSLDSRFYLRAHCFSDVHTGTEADLRLSISLDEGRSFTRDGIYEIQPYFSLNPAEEDAAYWSEPHVRAAVGTIYADEGWIQFRRAKDHIYAGNFEISFTDGSGIRHTIRHGNFDTFCK